MLDTIDKNHGKFGAALLKKWKFPDEYAHIATYHDHLKDSQFISNGLLITHFSNLLVKSMGYSMSDAGDVDVEESQSARLLKLDSQSISKIKDRVKTHMDDLKDFFA